MIIYQGIIEKPGIVSILRFKNENGAIVDIPIDKHVANTISLHLKKFSGTSSSVERGNMNELENPE